MLSIPSEAFEPMIVFSARDNDMNERIIAFCNLHNIPVKKVRGSWRGEARPYSFIAHATAFAPLFFNGFLDGQETVLYLHPMRSRDGGRRAELLTLHPHTLKQPAEDYGTWHAVSGEVALTKAGWTHDPATGKFYTCLDIPEGVEREPMMEVAA